MVLKNYNYVKNFGDFNKRKCMQCHKIALGILDHKS